ncbi:TPA: hypothetical protein MH595_09360 [Klebsiella pneumoniae]|nr:hypothetical protein [Klebsiella pneumoniae]
MNYTHLGRTGLKVSRLCLGTMNFGDVTDEKTSARILDEALEAGINFIDTADVYGTEQSPDIQQGSGLSEEIIGRWLQQGGRRERIVLATKVYQPMGPGPNDRRLSAYHIRKACEDSLRRLKTDHIDVYQMHHIDRHTPWEEIWQAMELLVQQGKVLYIGSSNFAGWDIATAQSVATARHFLGLVAEQSLYNLTARTIELELIPACRHFGLGLIPWSPLAGGLLGGVLHNALTCSAVPIPPWERSLQTVEAQPYFSVSQASLVLEGIVFDRNNNLLFVDVATGRVFKLTPERQLSIVLKENSFGASGLAVHKDGRIFIASVGDMQRGSVRAIEPNGTREQMIVAPDAGFLVNDLVFDNQGGFYFTDSRGNSADPQGGVFYVSPNVGAIHAILPGLAVGNGIAIDPAGSQIWATEHAKNRLHRVRLSDATTIAPFGSVVTYQFTGPAPDGARVDSEGNVYVAISGQGRVMVFNRNGLPIGQIVLPDRDKGRNLKSTSLAIRPGHRELFIVANSGTEPGGAMIFRSGAFAPAPFPFSHQ